ncbi:Uncharacterised protein [Acinetobacter baumannii]|uniref:DUF551 domain-containing protein n=1 Tax=Acinetobacter baumannii TaxID=470 RepID=UPI000DE65217|nr:DUF551 domain-containing protein [Acinetobacter baumannii]SSV06628.1 Uncharacterised protein [Acinetobacter baumannii]SSV58288.1 Uncharacterised protein [Acinetobacter baumannii]SSV63184.1 Uncharacterised protein [Acinetobacter baumannii]SSV68631.1 Uncharacterised protein [Acinetobacter baumannii]
MTDLNNPETIEIHGLRTITKLCHFGADNNMEGCTFTEIVERLFAELEKAKAQAVPEGYCLVPVELYNFQANQLAEEEFKKNKSLFDMEHRGISGFEVELRQAKWLVSKAESIKQNYRRLVKWASESGAEG